MPWKSAKQRRYMYANHPQIARKWDKKYGTKPTGNRSTQPYRSGARRPGAALAAMLRGKPQYLPNPQDLKRQTQRRTRRRV